MRQGRISNLARAQLEASLRSAFEDDTCEDMSDEFLGLLGKLGNVALPPTGHAGNASGDDPEGDPGAGAQ